MRTNKNAAVNIISENEQLSRTLVLLCSELGLDAVRSDECNGIVNIIDLTDKERIPVNISAAQTILITKNVDTPTERSENILVYPFAWEHLRIMLRRTYEAAAFAPDRLPKLSGNLLTASGKCVSLSKREATLFNFFAENPERVVDRKEIINAVWETDSENSNIVDVYINYLRKKLSEVTDDAYIRSVRGKGYVYTKKTTRI